MKVSKGRQTVSSNVEVKGDRLLKSLCGSCSDFTNRVSRTIKPFEGFSFAACSAPQLTTNRRGRGAALLEVDDYQVKLV